MGKKFIWQLVHEKIGQLSQLSISNQIANLKNKKY